ncbi:hypothetical protein AVEN_14318-1 [Araneus ventricosus]|uniref:Uncharacterized protein n=1 Tax=Araneus ventricosus TaxID=182803 RepID=A0A4Y2SYD9_ARAVE|nr:hypothetical protein AVEN_14318-1 [Araneus ventricosus]
MPSAAHLILCFYFPLRYLSKLIPHSNFSLQKSGSNLALQICKLEARLTRQECKLETSLIQVNANELVTTCQTCHVKLQIIAKREYEHNLGFEAPPYRVLNLSS